ncbi:MAG: hypothetical protein ABFR63_04900 [Thermodesulfobacteriota bacterium]
MKNKIQHIGTRGWLLLLTTFFIFSAPSFAVAEHSVVEIITGETAVIQGIIRRISTEKNSIIVKISKGEKIQLLFSPQSRFVGATSLYELERGQRVKVWYSSGEGEHTVLKLELLPELGC